MHGLLPGPKAHIRKLAIVLIVVDLEGQVAQKEKKKSGKRYSVLCLGKEFLGQKTRKGRIRKTQFLVECFFTVSKKKMTQINSE